MEDKGHGSSDNLHQWTLVHPKLVLYYTRITEVQISDDSSSECCGKRTIPVAIVVQALLVTGPSVYRLLHPEAMLIAKGIQRLVIE